MISDDHKSMPERRAELLEDLVAQTVLVLTGDFDLPEDLATHAGHALADHLADHWGGQSLSFPVDAAYRLCQREIAILAERDAGAHPVTLARKHGMSERGIRKLLKRAENRQTDTRQSDLQFPE